MSTNTCRHCEVFFVPTADDPAVSAASLGAGVYHYACARIVWRKKAERAADRAAAKKTARRGAGMRLTAWRAALDAQIAAAGAAEDDA